MVWVTAEFVGSTKIGEHLLGFSLLRLAGISDTPDFFLTLLLDGLILGVGKGPLSWEGGWYAGEKNPKEQKPMPSSIPGWKMKEISACLPKNVIPRLVLLPG